MSDAKDLARRLRQDEKWAPLRHVELEQWQGIRSSRFLPSNRLLAADMLEEQARRIHELEAQLSDARTDLCSLQRSMRAREAETKP